MDDLLWLQQLHLIRPYWLLALFPLALIIWLTGRAHRHSRSWATVIDKRLLPHLLQGADINKKPAPLLLLFIAGSLVILALAGPALEKYPQPVFKTQSALVIVLDLSRSMNATDIKPSRLSRAHFKINDILKLRKEGQTALIVYAASAYVITPLTEDAKTIASQISALETNIMPSQGSRLDIALDSARQLFTNAGHSKGHILVISDSVNSRDISSIEKLSADRFKTSILAIGTEEGAPIASQNGGFLKDSRGSIVVPRLDIKKMRQAALAGGGRFSLLTSDDRDINRLISTLAIETDKAGEAQTDSQGNKFTTDVWREEGPWLLLLILPLAAYAFRRGLIFVLIIFIFPLPQPVQASGWSDLWRNDNQQGAAALENGNAQQAAELFNDPQWKAAAQFKAGEYQQAAELLNAFDTAEANYNRGNALAKANDLENAIKAYDRALQLNPQHEDAQYNKQLLEQEKEKQKQEQKSQQGDKQQDSKDSQQSDSESDDSKSDSKQQNSQNSQHNSAPQQDAASEDAQQTASSKKSEEEKQKQEQEQLEDAQDSTEEHKPQQQNMSDSTPDLEQQQTRQWLKKIPDDPGGLLRRKFKYLYGRENQQNEQNPW